MKVDVKPTTPRLTADDDRHDAAPADASDLKRWVNERGSLEPLTPRDASTAFPTSNPETSSKSDGHLTHPDRPGASGDRASRRPPSADSEPRPRAALLRGVARDEAVGGGLAAGSPWGSRA